MSVVSATQLPTALARRRESARPRAAKRFASRPRSGARPRRRRPARVAHEAGFTLVEILVVLVVMSLAMTAILSLLEQSGRIANSDVERDTSLNEQAGAFNRMIDELRQAYAVNCPSGGCTNNATATGIDFDERVTTSGQADTKSVTGGTGQPGDIPSTVMRLRDVDGRPG